MNLIKPILLVWLVAAVLVSADHGRPPLKVKEDGRMEIALMSFGFEADGFFNITLTDYEFTAEDESKFVGIYMRRATSRASGALDADYFCNDIRDGSDSSHTIFKIRNGEWLLSHTIPSNETGFWIVTFVNCLQDNSKVSFTVDVLAYNVVNGQRNYLSVGDQALPAVYIFFFIAHLIATSIWFFALVFKKGEKKVLWPHWLMLLVIFVKAVDVGLEAGKYKFLGDNGIDIHNGWSITYYIFMFIEGILVFSVLVLIGSGWIFVKPLLSAREKQLILILIPVQILANTGNVIVDAMYEGSTAWTFWRVMTILLDVVSIAVVLIPICNTQKMIEQADPDGKAALLRKQYKLWTQLYGLAMMYIYFTRIIVRVLEEGLSYQITYLAEISDELATLLFYCVIGYKFRPEPNNPYLRVVSDEDEAENTIPMENLGNITKRTGREAAAD